VPIDFLGWVRAASVSINKRVYIGEMIDVVDHRGIQTKRTVATEMTNSKPTGIRPRCLEMACGAPRNFCS
jgi:hypothetical protein